MWTSVMAGTPACASVGAQVASTAMGARHISVREAQTTLPELAKQAFVSGNFTGDLLESPGAVGVELEGHLSRRYVASVADQRIVYRLDPTNRAVRVVDVRRGQRVFVSR